MEAATHGRHLGGRGRGGPAAAGDRPMKPAGTRLLCVLVVGAVFLCHGAFGVLHLVCEPPACAGGVGHAEQHQLAGATAGGAHGHPAGHSAGHPGGSGTGTEYFAVLIAGLAGLLLSLLLGGGPSGIGPAPPWPPLVRRAYIPFRLPPCPTAPVLQVFRL